MVFNHTELAEYLGVSERTLWRRVASLRIPKIKIGIRVFYDPIEVVEHLRRLRGKKKLVMGVDEQEHLENLGEVLIDGELAGPLKVRADSVILSPSAAHVFQFGKMDIRFPRMSYEIVHIEEVDNELGLWVGVTLLLEALIVDMHSLREYVV